MKIFLNILVLILLLHTSSYADHVAGGQITYKHITTVGNNSTYEIEVVVYGDCSGTTYPSWATTTAARLYIYKESALNLVHTLPRINAESDMLISPVCPTAINQTTCSGGSIVGIRKYTFRGNVVLNGNSANWRFVFTDELPGGQAPGRSLIADNVSNPGMFYTEARLNNLNGPNNSPSFYSNPVPFFCQGAASSFEISAIDPDGDSLVYSLVPVPLATNSSATYNPGYSATNPLNVVPGSFSFSAQTGVAEFTPNAAAWEGIVVNKVSEYRNGVMIGSVMREMMFVYLADCQNQAPVTTINNVSNGQLLNSSTPHKVSFNTCSAQQGTFSFEVMVSDPDLDNITVTATNLPSGAVLDVWNNGSANPVVSFSWGVGTAVPGTYHFYITYKDDGCPLARIKTVVYTINIQAFEGTFSIDHIAPCRNDTNALAWILPGIDNTTPFSYTWMDPSFNLLKPATGLQMQGDSLLHIGAGTYVVQVHNATGCMRQFALTIDTASYQARFETDSIVCINTPLDFNPNYANDDFTSWEWDWDNGNTSTLQFPQVQYADRGTYTIQLIGTTARDCKDTFEQTVIVDTSMRPEFELDRNVICAGEQINIRAVFGQHFKTADWDFGDGGRLSSIDSIISYGYPQAGDFEILMNAAYRACPDARFSRSITVHDYPKVDLGTDTGLCDQGNPIELKNSKANGSSDRFQWNTGATTANVLARQPGVYSLTVTRNDCSTTDSIDIKKDCYIDIPNAFIPGSGMPDGYFLPRSILARGVAQFSMKIYNRWGQLIFQTNNPEGSGWDGHFNGQAQAQGVYLYQIEVVYKDGKAEKYQGNVTLIR